MSTAGEPQTAQDRLSLAVSALQSKGSDIHGTEQFLKELQGDFQKAPLQPPEHMLPAGVDSDYQVKVCLSTRGIYYWSLLASASKVCDCNKNKRQSSLPESKDGIE